MKGKVENLGNTFFCKSTKIHSWTASPPTENCEMDSPTESCVIDSSANETQFQMCWIWSSWEIFSTLLLAEQAPVAPAQAYPSSPAEIILNAKNYPC